MRISNKEKLKAKDKRRPGKKDEILEALLSDSALRTIVNILLCLRAKMIIEVRTKV